MGVAVVVIGEVHESSLAGRLEQPLAGKNLSSNLLGSFRQAANHTQLEDRKQTVNRNSLKSRSDPELRVSQRLSFSEPKEKRPQYSRDASS
jgi:hypothetical protein